MIRLDSVSARSLHGVSLDIPAGTTSVIGTNGSGKTTLLELCCGLILPADGSVLIDGRPPRNVDTALVPAFPGASLLFSRVMDEIAACCRFAGLATAEVEDRVAAAADAVAARHLLDRSTLTLSGGERFKVSLAAALAARPQVLVIDELDGALDRESLAGMLPVLQSAGVPYILWSTHDRALASRAENAIALGAGGVIATGAAALALFVGWGGDA